MLQKLSYLLAPCLFLQLLLPPFILAAPEKEPSPQVTLPQISQSFDFRKTSWGMSLEQVKASEPIAPSFEKEDVLGYKTRILDKDVLLIYIFVRNKLVRTKYMLAEQHSNNNEYINDYDSFCSTLKKKYGKPITERTLWLNSLFKDKYEQFGMAISIGHLKYFSKWRTSTTEITAFLSGDNHKIDCGVEYSGAAVKELEKEEKEKKNLQDM